MKSTKTVYRLQAALQRVAPGLCLVSTLGAAAWLHFGEGGGRGHIVGFAETTPEAIAPIEVAKIVAVHVHVGDAVTPGQIVVELDTAAIDAEIAVAEAEKAQLEADVRASEAEILQKLDMDLASLEREAAKQREEHLQVTATAKALDSELARVKQLVEDRQVVFEELAKVDLERTAAAALAAEKPRTLNLLTKQIKAAEARRKAVKQEGSATADKLAADLRFAERNIELLKKRREAYMLRASRPGRVAAIFKRPGEVAVAGDPVLNIVSGGARVVACVPERVALGLREGDDAKLWIRGQASAPLLGKTVTLGPVVAELPIRCWTAPNRPTWGREVTVELEGAVNVLAGQAFDVVFQPSTMPLASPPVAPTKAATNAANVNAAHAANLPASVLPMMLPDALAKRTRFEPSGILAREAEGRYLVVSDDTGQKDKDTEGAPWVFGMSKDGAIEPEPLQVDGIDEVSDVEAIVAGDAGEIYLLSSQSYSKRGKRKPARTALLRLRKEGRGFRVDGEAHIAELLDADPAQAAALGLPNGTRALDIEGLAYRGGSLYFGLKAPLDAQGNAMIWQVTAPSALFASKPLASAGASLWARVRVDVEVAGKPTPGGISDLLFLPDGGLAISSTPSTADGDAGALWRVDAPASGALTPVLVRKWALKPEGIAPSLSAGKLMVVFDTGSTAPLFEEVPWAR
ncbi:biotin/lipoyl-binding protein [Polyangium sp. 15x6]|uniref:biotin/lipoyl-binding protein n=1 Tax=Polyangium sp. 15x6 TaxID=3042687 RepID=UPI00249BD0A3|nr:biotin/lipoyl-binding protein [Polyangium sp. 15x6]MDI3284487.1 hypothetical protein [Polyangium sp. 15x6]